MQESTSNPQILRSGSISYTIAHSPNSLFEDSAAFGDFTVGLTRKFQDFNTADFSTIHFDGNRYRVEERKNSHGWKGQTILIAGIGNGQDYYCKEFRFLKACVPYSEPPEMTTEEIDEPEIVYLEEFETLNGYLCQKVSYHSENGNYFLWITKSLIIESNAKGILRKKGIHGTILKLQDIPGKNDISIKEVTVSKIINKKPPVSTFVIPPDFVAFDNITIASNENRKRTLAEAKKRPIPPCIEASSYWEINSPADQILLRIQLGGSFVKLDYFFGSKNERNKTATLHGDWLMIDNGTFFEIYQLNKSCDSLINSNLPPYNFTRIQKQKFEKKLDIFKN